MISKVEIPTLLIAHINAIVYVVSAIAGNLTLRQFDVHVIVACYV